VVGDIFVPRDRAVNRGDSGGGCQREERLLI